MPTFNDALALFRRGERVAALSAATRALAATPSDPNLLNLLVELHAANGDPASASRHAAQAAVLCPDDAAAQRRLGQYAYAAGDRATAIDAYRRAIRLDSRNARAYNNLGNVLEADGARDEAIAAYRHAIEIDPGYALAHSNLATVLGAGGDHQGALKASETALGLRVELAPAWRQLAVSRLELRDLDGALVAADRATQLAAADPRAWFVRCRVLSELDRLEDGVRKECGDFRHQDVAARILRHGCDGLLLPGLLGRCGGLGRDAGLLGQGRLLQREPTADSSQLTAGEDRGGRAACASLLSAVSCRLLARVTRCTDWGWADVRTGLRPPSWRWSCGRSCAGAASARR